MYIGTYICPCGLKIQESARELLHKNIDSHRLICFKKTKKVNIPSDLPELPTQRVFNLF